MPKVDRTMPMLSAPAVLAGAIATYQPPMRAHNPRAAIDTGIACRVNRIRILIFGGRVFRRPISPVNKIIQFMGKNNQENPDSRLRRIS
jgi:hypothetical protein